MRYLFFLLIIPTLWLSHYVMASPSAGEENITLVLNDAEITELVKWASEVTRRNIILHPNVQGRVTVIAREPMSSADAYQVFLSVLQVHGLVAVEENGSVKVIPGVQAKESAIPLADDAGSLSEDTVVQILKATNISANNLVNLLKPLIPQTGYLAASPETNSIIVADRANNIRKILEVVERIDRGGTVEVDIIQVNHANANSVMGIVKELILTTATPESPAVASIAVDERSNSLLVTGDSHARQQVVSLIRHLDKPLDGDGNAMVLKIAYGNAVDMVPLLQGVVASLHQEGGQQSGELSIQAHDQLNALIIAGPRGVLAAIRNLVAQLDVPRSQVLVEALIVEVTNDLARNIGVEWRTANPGVGESVGSGFSSFPPDINPLGIENGEMILGSGLSLGYFRGGNLRAIINMLASETHANILSTPTIVSLDNEEAEILVGSNVPFITGSQQRPGDLDPFQTIQRQDIGVTLKVKPRINNDSSITLDIEQSVESIAPSSGATADIVTNKRMIRTRVQISDNDVLVLGGLMRDEMTDGENRVPGVGRLPVIGNLFKSKARKFTKTNLMVFIHPRILRDKNSSREASQQRYDTLRDIQLESGARHGSSSAKSPGPLLPDYSTPRDPSP